MDKEIIPMKTTYSIVLLISLLINIYLIVNINVLDNNKSLPALSENVDAPVYKLTWSSKKVIPLPNTILKIDSIVGKVIYMIPVDNNGTDINEAGDIAKSLIESNNETAK